MIRIVFLIGSLHRGGAEQQLTLLVRGLDHSRFHCTVVTIYEGGQLAQELENIENVEVLSVKKRGRSDSVAALWRLLRLTNGLAPDIVHGYLDSTNVLAILAGKLSGARVVWGVRSSSVQSAQLDRATRIYRRLGSILSSYTDLIIANSMAGRAYFVRLGYAANRILVIPNGFETDRFSPDSGARGRAREGWGVASNTPLVGLAARLDPIKDHPTFLRAAALLTQRMPDVKFVCIGGGGTAEYERELKQLATALAIDDRVIWAGETADMPAAQNGLDVATLVSSSEGFPNAVGEAMACTIPCVVTDVGDSAEIVGDTGISVRPGDPGALCEAWEAILGLPADERAHLGMRARQRILDRYSVASLVDRTSRELMALVDDSASRRTRDVIGTHANLGTRID
jgi:glycosyltransferase involved in cell wall biosynthesis